jgi:hypothetical protein
MGGLLGCPTWSQDDFRRLDAEASAQRAPVKGIPPKKLRKLLEQNEASLKLLREKSRGLGRRLVPSQVLIDEAVALRKAERSQSITPGVQAKNKRLRELKEYQEITAELRSTDAMVAQQENVLKMLRMLSPTLGGTFVASTADKTREFIEKHNVEDRLAELNDAHVENRGQLSDALQDIQHELAESNEKLNGVFEHVAARAFSEDGEDEWAQYDLPLELPDTPVRVVNSSRRQALPPPPVAIAKPAAEPEEEEEESGASEPSQHNQSLDLM